jgi:hypothetical protein
VTDRDLYTLAYYLEAGLVQPPIFLQTIVGVMGGIGPEVEHLVHLKSTADRLLGESYQWSVLGAGRHQFNMITAGAVMGSHVRVGLEDGLFIGKGQLAASNAEQVEKIKPSSVSCPWRSPLPRRPAPCSGSRGWTRWVGDPMRAGRRAHRRGDRLRGHRRRLGRALPASRLRRCRV